MKKILLAILLIVSIPTSAIGDTAYTVYANSNDGFIRSSNANWNTARGGSNLAVNVVNDRVTPAAIYVVIYYIFRAYTQFDIPALTGTISSVSLNLYRYDADTPYSQLVTVQSSCGSTLSSSDWGKYSTTEFSSRVDYSTWAAGYNSISLNAAGISYITSSINSTAKFASLQDKDFDNTTVGVATSTKSFSWVTTETDGTSQDPKLIITVAAPVPAFSASSTSALTGQTITFTDSSTNVGNGTTYAWTFGDGDTSTDQNPTHAYKSQGAWTVALTVTNSGGVVTETKTAYITTQTLNAIVNQG